MEEYQDIKEKLHKIKSQLSVIYGYNQMIEDNDDLNKIKSLNAKIKVVTEKIMKDLDEISD